MTIGAGIDTLKNLAGWIIDHGTKILAVICPVFGLLYYWDDIIAFVKQGLTDIQTYLAAINAQATGSTWSTLATYFGYADNIFPVHEVFIMIGIYITLRCLCVVIRVIKGLIPTMG